MLLLLVVYFAALARLRDDPRLGTLTGVIPDIVIVEPIYRDLHDSWKVVRAQEMRAITGRLEAYQLAFDNTACQVYIRRER